MRGVAPSAMPRRATSSHIRADGHLVAPPELFPRASPGTQCMSTSISCLSHYLTTIDDSVFVPASSERAQGTAPWIRIKPTRTRTDFHRIFRGHNNMSHHTHSSYAPYNPAAWGHPGYQWTGQSNEQFHSTTAHASQTSHPSGIPPYPGAINNAPQAVWNGRTYQPHRLEPQTPGASQYGSNTQSHPSQPGFAPHPTNAAQYAASGGSHHRADHSGPRAAPAEALPELTFYPFGTEGPRLRTIQACQKCRTRKAKVNFTSRLNARRYRR